MEKPTIVTAYQQKPDGTLATVIPKSIREKLGIVKGTRFIAFVDDGVIGLKPIEEKKNQTTQGVDASTNP